GRHVGDGPAGGPVCLGGGGGGSGPAPQISGHGPAVIGRDGLGGLRVRAAREVAGGIGTGGVTLVQQVVAFLAGRGGLAARPPEPAARSAAALGGPAGPRGRERTAPRPGRPPPR